MANTYTLISSTTLSSSAATVTFSSIPSTYTDLVLRASARTDDAYYRAEVYLQFNSDSATNYSTTWLNGYAASPSGSRSSATSKSFDGSDLTDGASSTTNVFGNLEIYIPNYLVSANKQICATGVIENNSSTDGQYGNMLATSLWQNTAAISSITITSQSTKSFIANSSFYLYGILKS